MPPDKKIDDFPGLEAKLQKPTRQSAFERQKAEAEAKRRREEAETAAAYEDFVKTFEHDEDDDGSAPSARARNYRSGGPPEKPAFGDQAYGGGAGKRHFGASSALRSGPGSLGPPSSLYGKKRPNDGPRFRTHRESEDSRGRLDYEDRDSGSTSVLRAFDASDDEPEVVRAARAEERAISKPTLRLANLPPGTSPAVVKAMVPPKLVVENVKIIPPTGPGGTDRKYIAAIVTFSNETPAAELDSAVSTLQNRYLGWGYYLSLHRHLSSAAIASGLPALAATSSAAPQPFGAKKVDEPRAAQHAQATGHGRKYAPPSSYGPPLGGPLNRGGILHVPVQPPKDIRILRMIHKVIEAVLAHGPEFEALLMSRPDVQREEKWSWIWDARSEGGVWYRWRLWEIVTGASSVKKQGKYIPVFEGSHAWKRPDARLAYEYTTAVNEFVSDSEYNSSDEDDFDYEPNRQGELALGGNELEDRFLCPLDKARLAHLLARLPQTFSKIRKGDIARITTFAITHASRGADEVVDMIATNIEKPFSFTSANPGYKPENRTKECSAENARDPASGQEDRTSSDSQDLSGARLLGLYVASDILSSSSTSGVRHAWRYRQLFETAFRKKKTLEMLGLMAEKHNWGRLRAEKWKRSIGLVLALWEGWCVFPVESQEFLVNSFESPSSAKKSASTEAEKKTGRWKTVDAPATGGNSSLRPGQEQDAANTKSTDGRLEMVDEEEDSDPPWMYYSTTWDETLFDKEDLDGEPLEDFMALMTVAEEDMQAKEAEGHQPTPSVLKPISGFQLGENKGGPRKRLRAADMFADTGSSGDEK